MSLDGTNSDPPATPPAEAFDSLAAHAAHYNAEDQAVPVAPVTPVEPAAEASPPDVSAAEAPEAPGPSDAEPEPARDERGQFVKQPKPRSDPRARVEHATREAAAAKRHAAELEARLQAIETQRTAAAPPTAPAPEAIDPSDPKPKLDQFLETEDPYAELAAALGRWGARQEHKTIRQRELLNARDAAIHSRLGTFQAAIATAREQFPDWDEKVSEIDDVMTQVGFSQWPPVMLEAILYSDKAIDVTRYLATHPEDTVQLARETARLDAAAVPVVRRLLEARLPGGAAVVSTGPAPAPSYRPAARPIAPVRTTSPATVDRPPGDEASFSDHKRYWDRQEREERRRH